MSVWGQQDRPKWYREFMEKTEGKYSLKELSEMSLVQMAALNVFRYEMTLAEAIAKVNQRNQNHGKTG